MTLYRDFYLNLHDQRQQVATREQGQQKNVTVLKIKQWDQYKVKGLVLSLMQLYISRLKPDTRACSSHPKFGDYPASSEVSLRLIKFPYACQGRPSQKTLLCSVASLCVWISNPCSTTLVQPDENRCLERSWDTFELKNQKNLKIHNVIQCKYNWEPGVVPVPKLDF